MYQLELFSEDERPERRQSWIMNPSAPTSEDELAAFFHEIEELQTEPEDTK